MNKQNGFTLIEMLIVLTIISTLLILLVPNLADKNTVMQGKGCDALLLMVESQVQAYEIEYGESPTDIDTLKAGDYIKDNTCDSGRQEVTITADGTIQLSDIVDQQ